MSLSLTSPFLTLFCHIYLADFSHLIVEKVMDNSVLSSYREIKFSKPRKILEK